MLHPRIGNQDSPLVKGEAVYPLPRVDIVVVRRRHSSTGGGHPVDKTFVMFDVGMHSRFVGLHRAGGAARPHRPTGRTAPKTGVSAAQAGRRAAKIITARARAAEVIRLVVVGGSRGLLRQGSPSQATFALRLSLRTKRSMDRGTSGGSSSSRGGRVRPHLNRSRIRSRAHGTSPQMLGGPQ